MALPDDLRADAARSAPPSGSVVADTAIPPASTSAPIEAARVARSPVDATDVTGLLAAWSAGDRDALDALLPAVYAELRRQAQRALRRERAGATLQPTALVHEAYLRLVVRPSPRWENRSHFLAVAARCMRQVLVDAARSRQAVKRGGGAWAVTLSDMDAAAASGEPEVDVEVLALDAALERLAALDPMQARLVELRYFAGFTLDETAAVLGVSAATVSREWSVARRWLRRELTT